MSDDASMGGKGKSLICKSASELIVVEVPVVDIEGIKVGSLFLHGLPFSDVQC